MSEYGLKMSLYGFSGYSNKLTNFMSFTAYQLIKRQRQTYAIACYIAVHEQLIIYSVGRLDFGVAFYYNKE